MNNRQVQARRAASPVRFAIRSLGHVQIAVQMISMALGPDAAVASSASATGIAMALTP